MSRRILLCILAATHTSAFAADAPPGLTSEERFDRMERALQQLQQRNAELEEKVRHLEAREADAPSEQREIATSKHAPAGQPTSPSRSNERPIVPVTQRAFELRLNGFVQTQLDVGDVSASIGRFPDNPANAFNTGEVKDRFVVRRARLSLNGAASEQLDFRVEGELFAGVDTASVRTAVAARDVFIRWRALTEFNLQVGQFKMPYGLEQLTSDSRLVSIEPSLVTFALAPDRQIGVQISGQPFANILPTRPDLLTYYAGVFNGAGSNTARNDNSELMYAGRIEVSALKSRILNDWEATVRIGANGFYSRDDVSNTVSDALLVNEDGSLSPFNFSPAGNREALGVDIMVRLGPVELIGEYLHQRLTPRESSGFIPQMAELRPNGYYFQGSYLMLGDKLQLLAKWESFDPDQRANDDIHTFTAGVNYLIRGDEIKLLANYVHTWADFRANNPRFGRDEFDQVSLRLQVRF